MKNTMKQYKPTGIKNWPKDDRPRIPGTEHLIVEPLK